MGKSVATTTEAPLPALPDALASLFAEEAGQGMEDVSPDDIQLPFIKQVQDISPERDDTAPEYIKGANSGDLFNSVTREIYDREGLEVIPASFRNTVVAFKPRKSGGGFLGEYESKEQALEHLDEPAELVESVTVAIMYRPMGSSDSFQPALLSLSKSKVKVARGWRTQLLGVRIPVGTNDDGTPKTVQPPIYGTRFCLTSVRTRNNKGAYYNLNVRFLGSVGSTADALLAKSFGEAMNARELRAGFDAETFGADDDGSKPAF